MKKFYAGQQADKEDTARRSIHILLSSEEREALRRLTGKMKMSAAAVVRKLIAEAS